MVATRKVIEIDVRDETFQKHKADFEAYEKEVKSAGDSVSKMAGGYQESSDVLDRIAEVLSDIKSLLEENLEATRDYTEEQEKAEETLTRQRNIYREIGTEIRGMAHNAGDMLSRVTGVVTHFASLSTLWGGMSALMGLGGGLFGMSALGSSATNLRTQSRSLGVSPGALQAMQVNFGPYMNVDGVLGANANAQLDPGGAVALMQLGLNPGQNAGRLAQQEARLARDVWRQNSSNPMLLGADYRTQALQQLGFNLSDIRNLGSISDSEFNRRMRDAGRDTHALGVSDPMLREWQDFRQQLDRASAALRNTFLGSLHALAPALGNLSSELNGLLKSALSDPHVKEWINDLAGGLHTLSDEIKSGDLAKQFHEITDTISRTLASQEFKDALQGIERGAIALGKVLGYFIPSSDSSQSGGSGSVSNGGGAVIGAGIGALAGSIVPGVGTVVGAGIGAGLGYTSAALYNEYNWIHGSSMPKGAANVPKNLQDELTQEQDAERRYGLPQGTLVGLAGIESSHGRHQVGNADPNDLGWFQFNRANLKPYGITNPFDFKQELEAAGKYMQSAMQTFHGNTDAAIASYNRGAPAVQRMLQNGGLDPKAQIYANHVRREAGILIRDNTGGSVQIGAIQAGGTGGNGW